jgi:hypothetical protein
VQMLAFQEGPCSEELCVTYTAVGLHYHNMPTSHRIMSLFKGDISYNFDVNI